MFKSCRRAAKAICILPTLLFALEPALAQSQRPFDHAALAANALERHIRPGYASLAAAAVKARQSVSKDCNATGAASRKRIEAAYDRLITAWGRIEHIRFGPITAQNRLERIMFWPDRRGIGARQLTRAVTKRDESILDPTTLATKSVALQGLTALEFVLFPRKGWRAIDASERAYRCRFAGSITANLAAISQQVSDDWANPDGFASHWLRPGTGNPHLVLASETTLALAKAFSEGTERVRDDRIGGPMGLNPEQRKTPIVLAASNRTMRLVLANIDGLIDLFEAGGISKALLATNFKDPRINPAANLKLISSELNKARNLARQTIRVPKPFESSAAQSRLVALGFPLKNARIQTAALLTLIADLSFGFNSSDGD